MSDAAALVLQAIELSHSRKNKQAHDLLNQAIALDPTNARAYFERARTLIERNKNAAALPDLDKCLQLDPAFPGAQRCRATVHKDMGHFQLAAQDLFNALRQNPNSCPVFGISPSTWADCAEYFDQAGDHNTALEVLEEFFSKHEANVKQFVHQKSTAWRLMARLLIKTGQPARAMEFAQKALALPKEKQCSADDAVYALALEATGQKEEALKFAQKRIKSDWHIKEYAQIIQRITGKSPASATPASEVQHPPVPATEPVIAKSAKRKAPAPKKEKRPALGKEIHKQIKAFCAQGDDFMENQDFTSAYSAYVKAYNLVPEPQENWEATTLIVAGIGDALFFLNKFEKALAPFNQALHCPDGLGNPFIHLRLGQCYFETGNLDLAAENLARAYILDGREMFDNNDPKYLAFLATRLDPPEGQDTL